MHPYIVQVLILSLRYGVSSLFVIMAHEPVVCFIIEIMRMTDVASSTVYVRYAITLQPRLYWMGSRHHHRLLFCVRHHSHLFYTGLILSYVQIIYNNHFKADWHLLSIWVILLHVAYRLYLRDDYKHWYNSDMYEYVYPILGNKKLYTMVQRMFLIVDFLIFRWYNTYKSTLLMVLAIPFNLLRYC